MKFGQMDIRAAIWGVCLLAVAFLGFGCYPPPYQQPIPVVPSQTANGWGISLLSTSSKFDVYAYDSRGGCTYLVFATGNAIAAEHSAVCPNLRHRANAATSPRGDVLSPAAESPGEPGATPSTAPAPVAPPAAKASELRRFKDLIPRIYDASLRQESGAKVDRVKAFIQGL